VAPAPTFQTFAPTVTVAPAPVAAGPVVVPFTDVDGCVKWTIGKFQSLGVKGQEIQKILAAMEIPNLTSIKPSQFAELVERVEAIQ
jgi:hypothetical protein